MGAIQTIYFLKAIGPRISKLILPSASYSNTQIQIHKYTNTAYYKVPERPNMWYIFEKRIVQRYQKLYSHVSNAQIQKYKYTNTQIQHMTKCQIDPTCGIFLKRGLFKDIKNYIPTCRTHKYKITNTKYTNTAYDKLPERPSMCYIFENRIVQGYQKLYSRVSNSQIQKYKYTNTQIQHMTNCQKDPACAIFLKIGLFKNIKNDIPVCQTHKYKNTNTKKYKYKIHK